MKRILLTSTAIASLLFVAAGPVGAPSVPNLASLKALAPGQFKSVEREGFSLVADGGDAKYSWSSLACTIASGAGDDGYQVKPNTGVGCWIMFWPHQGADFRAWGVKFDNSTDNAGTLSKAIAAHNVTGGKLIAPAGIAKFGSALASITKGGEIAGVGIPGVNACSVLTDASLGASTVFRASSGFSTGDLFTVATEERVAFRDLMIDYEAGACPGTPRASGAMIAVVGANSRYTRNFYSENVQGRYQFDCYRLDFVNAWQLEAPICLDFKNDAVKVVNTDASVDYGDWTITRPLFWNVDFAAANVGRAGLEFFRGGSGEWAGGKINGTQYGILVNRVLSSGTFTATATMMAHDISIENYTVCGILLLQSSVGADYAVFNAHDLEFSAFSGFANPSRGDVCVDPGTPGGTDTKWIRNIGFHDTRHNIGYTTAGGSYAVIDIQDGLMVDVHNARIDNNGVTPAPYGIRVAGAVSNCAVYDNKYIQAGGKALYAELNACDGPTQAWTPTLAGSTTPGTPTYSTRVGSYSVRDQEVVIRGHLVISAWAGPVGSITISNVPITVANISGNVGTCAVTQWSGLTLDAGYTFVGANIQPGGNTLSFTEEGSGVSAANLPVAAGSAFTIQFDCTYQKTG